MFALTMSLAACLGWGTADFLAGLKARALPTLTVMVLANLFGTAVITLIILIRAQGPPADPELFWALAAGAAGVAAMLLLYRALAVGTMAVVAPISGAGVIIPVVVGLVAGDQVSRVQAAGMIAALIGSLLAAREKKAAGRTPARGVGLAVCASVAVGLFFVVMDRASAVDPYWAAMYMRLSYSLLLVPLILVFRPSLRVKPAHLPGLFAAGSLDSLANFFFSLAVSVGLLSLVSVTASLYPAVTVLLSMTILKERPQPVQILGVVLALTGIGLISAG